MVRKNLNFIQAVVIFILMINNVLAEQVKIHYKRYEKDYKNWNLWIWEEGKQGDTYYFTEKDEYGVVATVDGDKKIGFLLKKGNWEERDVMKDRYIEIKEGINEVYLVEDKDEIYSSLEKVNIYPKLRVADLTKRDVIEFELRNIIENKDLEVKVVDEEGNELEIKEIETFLNNKIGKLYLKKEIDITKTYYLEISEHEKTKISYDKIFSSPEFEKEFVYLKKDLGANYSKKATKFRVWAPTAQDVLLNLYKEGEGENLIKTIPMEKDKKGTWVVEEKGDLDKIYYTYSVTVAGEKYEVVDIYAKAVGVNGKRGMIIDLKSTNPKGWSEVPRPKFEGQENTIVYEMHVRDFSIDNSSGIKNKGKYLGMVESGSKNSFGESTGIDYLKKLGVTHIQLLPVMDYASVDETRLNEKQFNWGYDPENYQVPEGSYSSNPYDGEVRIREFKEMIMEFHKNGIRVIMDVVFNHTAKTQDSNFNKIVPNYYYRKSGENFANASACGNETASERAMMRKYIVDTVVYWAKEYKVDGFRFDLMGIHDLETMNEVRKALDKVDKSIVVYGEPWAAGAPMLAKNEIATKENILKLDRVGAFNDDIRDGIKGSVFNSKDRGFATGKENQEERIKFGIVGAVEHSQVNYVKPWANSPIQSVNYVSAHDNLTLWDKINSSNFEDSLENKKMMNKLSASIVFTSQGIIFFHGGEEILRSKINEEGKFDENSYKSSDFVNSIKWNLVTENKDILDYYRGLIEFRKDNPGLRLNTQREVAKNISFLTNMPKQMVGYLIEKDYSIGQEKDILIIHNARKEDVKLKLPKGNWGVYVDGKSASKEKLYEVTGEITISKISTLILKKGE